MPASPEFFALELTSALVEEQVAFVNKWIQLKRVMIDDCPGCPGPPVDLVQKNLATLNQVLTTVTQMNTTIVQSETVPSRQAAVG